MKTVQSDETFPCDLIPNFDNLYNATVNFVRDHQGDKGYIDTQGDEDTISTIIFDDESGRGVEEEVHGVRVTEDGDLQIVCEPFMRTVNIEYTDEDFKNDDNWHSIRYSDVYYVFTLIDIASYIHEYVDNE